MYIPSFFLQSIHSFPSQSWSMAVAQFLVPWFPACLINSVLLSDMVELELYTLGAIM